MLRVEVECEIPTREVHEVRSKPSVARFSAALAVGVVLLLIGLMGPAFAAQDPVLTDQQRTQLTQEFAAFRDCLQQNGVTLPERPAAGLRGLRPMLTDEQRAAFKGAREACGDLLPDRPVLSDEQRAQLRTQHEAFRSCLQENGVTLPERAAAAHPLTRPMLTDEQRAELEQARRACGDLRPDLGFRDGHQPAGTV
jgi:hypothetical protein